jgi:hypothetical protein
VDPEIKSAYTVMLKALEKVKIALDEGDLMGDPAILGKSSEEMAKFLSILNQLNSAIYKGRQSYDKILY